MCSDLLVLLPCHLDYSLPGISNCQLIGGLVYFYTFQVSVDSWVQFVNNNVNMLGLEMRERTQCCEII